MHFLPFACRQEPGAENKCQAEWLLPPHSVLLYAGGLDFYCSVLVGDVTYASCWPERSYCCIVNLLFLSPSLRFRDELDLLFISAFASLIKKERSGIVST